MTGGTGLIGSRLIEIMVGRGDQIMALTRDAARASRQAGHDPDHVQWIQGDPGEPGPWWDTIDGCDVAVHLAGENVFAKRWSAAVKQEIRESRVRSTELLASAIVRVASPPSTLIQGSAIGYYGSRGDGELTESATPGDDFMAGVCKDWEAAAAPVADRGIRVALLRTGIVLDRDAGALKLMTPIFRWVPGGAAPVGSAGGSIMPGKGRQWMSWIHLDDLVGIILMAIDHPEASGPINGTAPNPVRNAEFSRALARVLHRPYLPIGPPDILLRIVLGEVAKVVTEGQRVIPDAASRLGYHFRFPELSGALADLLGEGRDQGGPP